MPTVIGWLKPVVLLPASALAGLAPNQMEAILAHELAHIRRHDYIVNLLQTVVETLLFYHPAVWWLSRRIRAERENCCDDLAVSLCGDPVAYAAALAELEGLRSTTGELVLAATGGSLLQRVRRLLGVPTHAGRAPGWLAAGLALLVVISMSAGAVARDALTGELAGGRTGGPGGARGTGAAGKHASGRCRRSHRAARAIRAAGGDRCRAAVTARAFRRGSAVRTGVGRHDADGSSAGRHSADGSGTASPQRRWFRPRGPIRRPASALPAMPVAVASMPAPLVGPAPLPLPALAAAVPVVAAPVVAQTASSASSPVHVAHDERW